jgi:hypothetical protein
VSGNLETKYKVKDLGLTFTEKWNTDNTLNTTVDIQDKLMPGLKVIQRYSLLLISGLWIRIDSMRIRIQHFSSIRIRIRLLTRTFLDNFFLKFF